MKLFNLIVTTVVLIFFLSGCGKDRSEQIRLARENATRAEQLFHEGKYTESFQALDENLQICLEFGLDSLSSENLYLRAQCREHLGEYDSAQADYKNSMLFARRISDKRLERLNKFSLSKFYFELGDYKQSQQMGSGAATVAKVFSDNSMVFEALYLAADADWRIGNIDRAIRTIDEMKRLHGFDSDKPRQHTIVKLQAEMFTTTGRDKDMRNAVREWREAFTKSRDNEGLVLSYLYFGRFQESISHPDSALRLYAQALSLLDPRSHPGLATDLFISLGNLAYQLRQFGDAKRYYSEARERTGSSASATLKQLLSLSVTACDWKLMNRNTPSSAVQELMSRCAKVLEYSSGRNIPEVEALASYLRGRLEEQQADKEKAAAFYSRAIEAHERHYAGLSGPALYQRIWDVILQGEQLDWYGALLSMYVSQSNLQSAFELAERASLRDFSGFFSTVPFFLQDQRLSAAAENFLWKQRCLSRVQKELSNENGSAEKSFGNKITALQASMENYRKQYLEAADEVNRLSSVSWLLTRRQVSLQAVRDSLPANAALLEFIVSPKDLHILIIRKDSVAVRKVAVERGTLLSSVSEFKNVIRNLTSPAESQGANSVYSARRMKDLSADLYSTLIAPVLPELQGANLLYVVSPKELDWVPFHALGPRQTTSIAASGHVVESKYNPVIERFSVRYLPSASALLYPHIPQRSVRTVVGFGYPGTTNWDVEYELKDIRSFYEKAVLLFDTSAAFHNLTNTEYDLLHITAEVSLDQRLPNRSSVTLADGSVPGRLRYVSIGEFLRIPATQVTLLSNVSSSPGMLARYTPNLLLVHGSGTLIATMWRGDRKAKRYFGEIFYTNLTAGIPVDEAYRLSVLSLLKRGEFSALHRWGLYYQFGK